MQQYGFILIHSPLVGPHSWSLVAEELTRRDYLVIVPSLLGIAQAQPPFWKYAATTVANATRGLEEPVILVGHSGAGPLLPNIAANLSIPTQGYIFVDAGIPATREPIPRLPRPLFEELRTKAVDGRVPPWGTWWGDEAMQALIPNDELRAAVVEEIPSLPLAYFEESIPVIDGWEEVPSAYLLFSSAAYGEEARQARTLGWPFKECHGEHLHMLIRPDAVADSLVELATRLCS